MSSSVWMDLLAGTFVLALLWPRFAWELRYPFLLINGLLWFSASPVTYLAIRKPNNGGWLWAYFWLTLPARLSYSVLAYLLLTPLRIINAIYFNIVLFWSVAFRQEIKDFAARNEPYSSHWTLLDLLFDLLMLCWRCAIMVLRSVVMTLFDVAWPTLTLFHGTPFDHNADSIVRFGWLVGEGNYAGTGIYFSITQGVAEYYAKRLMSEVSQHDYSNRVIGTPAVIVTRAVIFPTRSVGTLSKKIRNLVGRDGDTISRSVNSLWATLLHWRADRKWYEFCLVHPKKGEFVNTWRIRPICVVERDTPSMIRGSLSAWPGSVKGWTLVSLTILSSFLLPAAIALSLLSSIDDYVGPPSPAPLNTVTVTPTSFLCPGAPESRLRIGDEVCVLNLGRDRLNLRSGAGTSNIIIGKLYRGDRLTIVGGPECANGYIWWQVSTEGDKTGWVAEGQKFNYFLGKCRDL